MRTLRCFTAGLCLLFCFGVIHADAWEFNLQQFDATGQYIRLYQTGSNGFFGPYDVDRSVNILPPPPPLPFSAGNCAPRNFWNGFTTASGSSSAAAFGTAAARAVLIVNPAISIKSDVWVGPQIPGILPNSGAPFGFTVWGTGWAQIEMPIGRLYLGKRPFGKGLGLQFAGTSYWADMLWYGRAEDFIELEVPYGPLTFNLGFYPWSLPDLFTNTFYYPDPSDTNAQSVQELVLWVDLTRPDRWKLAPETYPGPTTQVQSPRRPRGPDKPIASLDSLTNEGWVYFKYFNGRIFFNAEADWYVKETRRQTPLSAIEAGIVPTLADGSGRYTYAPLYVNALRYMTEFGAICGPLKVSALYTWIPGQDRRHGILINNQSLVQGPAQSAARVFQPYATMMPYFYRSGNNSFLDMTDAWCLGIRADYSVASNMDLSASWFRARRLSKGYGVAYWALDPNGDIMPIGAIKGNFLNPTPAIPDDDLGTEWNFSVRWKLLENFMVKTTWGYFIPGNWWKFACIDKSIPGWDVQAGVAHSQFLPPPPVAAPYGINPNRTIAPVGMLRAEAWVYF